MTNRLFYGDNLHVLRNREHFPDASARRARASTGSKVSAIAERTAQATWRRIGALLDAFKPDECANCLRSSGYGAA